jgi:drug/metabolite transporter (DMT)-like permease
MAIVRSGSPIDMQILRSGGMKGLSTEGAPFRIVANTTTIPLARHLLLVVKEQERLMNKMLGIILVVVGIVGLAWGGFSFTTREKIADIGPIHASRDKSHSVPLPPIAGALALVGGVALLVVGKNG